MISVWTGECGRLYRNTEVSLGSNQATAPNICRKVSLVPQKDHSRSLSPALNLAPDICTSSDPLSWMSVKLRATLEHLTRRHPAPSQPITSFIDPTPASPGLCKWNNLLGQRQTGVPRACQLRGQLAIFTNKEQCPEILLRSLLLEKMEIKAILPALSTSASSLPQKPAW